MTERIAANLHRQSKALVVLFGLLQEEFSALKERAPQDVSRIELSLQELLRQMAAERASLKLLLGQAQPGAKRVADLFPALAGDQAQELRELLAQVDRSEQSCAVQAEKNNHLAVALADQNRNMLEFLHKEIQPKGQAAYGVRGKPTAHRPEAALISRRS